MNDVTVGQYDIVMETGPGYSTKRQEAVESMMAALTANPNLFGQIGDLVFRNMDFPGAEIIADRLASVNPLANIDDQFKRSATGPNANSTNASRNATNGTTKSAITDDD